MTDSDPRDTILGGLKGVKVLPGQRSLTKDDLEARDDAFTSLTSEKEDFPSLDTTRKTAFAKMARIAVRTCGGTDDVAVLENLFEMCNLSPDKATGNIASDCLTWAAALAAEWDKSDEASTIITGQERSGLIDTKVVVPLGPIGIIPSGTRPRDILEPDGQKLVLKKHTDFTTWFTTASPTEPIRGKYDWGRDARVRGTFPYIRGIGGVVIDAVGEGRCTRIRIEEDSATFIDTNEVALLCIVHERWKKLTVDLTGAQEAIRNSRTKTLKKLETLAKAIFSDDRVMGHALELLRLSQNTGSACVILVPRSKSDDAAAYESDIANYTSLNIDLGKCLTVPCLERRLSGLPRAPGHWDFPTMLDPSVVEVAEKAPLSLESDNILTLLVKMFRDEASNRGVALITDVLGPIFIESSATALSPARATPITNGDGDGDSDDGDYDDSEEEEEMKDNVAPSPSNPTSDADDERHTTTSEVEDDASQVVPRGLEFTQGEADRRLVVALAMTSTHVKGLENVRSRLLHHTDDSVERLLGLKCQLLGGLKLDLTMELIGEMHELLHKQTIVHDIRLGSNLHLSRSNSKEPNPALFARAAFWLREECKPDGGSIPDTPYQCGAVVGRTLAGAMLILNTTPSRHGLPFLLGLRDGLERSKRGQDKGREALIPQVTEVVDALFAEREDVTERYHVFDMEAAEVRHLNRSLVAISEGSTGAFQATMDNSTDMSPKARLILRVAASSLLRGRKTSVASAALAIGKAMDETNLQITPTTIASTPFLGAIVDAVAFTDGDNLARDAAVKPSEM